MERPPEIYDNVMWFNNVAERTVAEVAIARLGFYPLIRDRSIGGRRACLVFTDATTAQILAELLTITKEAE